MKIVKVTYTTRAEFAQQNQNNIKNVMTDLKKLRSSGINYNVCVAADGKSFTHTAFFKTDEEQNVLNALPAFKFFQEQLKTSGLEVPPKQEMLSFVASSTDIFQ